MGYIRCALVTSLFLLSATPLFAQAQGGSGDIRGFVLDGKDSGIPNARIAVTSPESGLSRTTETGPLGEYRVGLLRPGKYQVRIDAQGFTAKTIESVEVRVGDEVSLPVRLEAGVMTTEVFVTADVPVVETRRTQQSTTIDARRLDNLPINQRDYLNFTLLAPGVVATGDLVDGTDFRVVQTPSSGLSFGGSNGRGNIVLIDGVENYSNSGGVRLGVGQGAVQEFQINRNSYSAEFGGSYGGSINIVTRYGTNTGHGEAFGYFRGEALDAHNYFDPSKSEYRRGQEGISYGGPIRRDRTFFFGSFERLDRHETAFVPLLADPNLLTALTPSQQGLLNYLDSSPSLKPLSTQLRAALTTQNYPATVKLFQDNNGAFPFDGANTLITGRVDQQWNPRNTSFFRTSYGRSRDDNAHLGALIARNRGRSIAQDEFAAVGSHISIPATGWVSETRGEAAYYKFGITPNDPIGPQIDITGYGLFGREIFQPFQVGESHFQLQENVDHTFGVHQFKFGADINAVRDNAHHYSFADGRFSFGQAIPLALVLNTAAGNPNFAAGLGQSLAAGGQSALAASLSVPITSLQAYNLGLPTFYQQGFGDVRLITWQPRISAYVQDTMTPVRSLALNLGLRYELEQNPKPVSTNHANFAPRIGFAWSPGKSGGTVIRGGIGLYYSQINVQAYTLPLTLDGVAIPQIFVSLLGSPALINQKTHQPLTSADIYRTLLGQGVIGTRQIEKQDLAQFGVTPQPNAAGRVIFGIVPGMRNPYGEQASFEIERAIGKMSVSAAYVYNRGVHLIRSLDRNLVYTGRLANGQPTFGVKDPTILQNNVLESTANSSYNALILQVTRRFAKHMAFNAHYTFSKAMDDVTDYNSDFQPQDQLNPKADHALSSWNQKHRVVINGVFESPLHASQRGAMAQVFGDLTFALIFNANSGRPFNVLTGVDNYGDNHPTTHRPFGLGRNVGRGPAYASFDARLSRRFQLGSDARRSFDVMLEGFNILNRTNFKTVNNTAGNVGLSQLPNPIMGVRGVPTQLFGFTSAYDPRVLQIGGKLNF